MFTIQSRKDGFKLTLPDNFLVPEVIEKYTPILREKKGYVVRPIDFLNETIQRIDVFGFTDASWEQSQPTSGNPVRNPYRIDQNNRLTGGSTFQYRNFKSPIALTDRTLNIEFRHTLGYLNYVMIMENFIYLYCKDTPSNKLFDNINIELMNHRGELYSKIVLMDPVINSMDMLSFDYTQPVAQSGTFKVEFKYSNFDYVIDTNFYNNDNSLLNIN